MNKLNFWKKFIIFLYL